MRLSGIVTEIWRLKDDGVTSLTYGVTCRHRSRDYSTSGVNFICVVYSDHASILHRYGDMAHQILDARTWTRNERRKKGKRKKKEGDKR